MPVAGFTSGADQRERGTPLLLLTWDLPPQSGRASYSDEARNVWIPSVLGQRGVVELRAYRNATQTRPEVLAFVEFDSPRAIEEYIASQQYASVITGLRSAGCGNIAAQVWYPSPIAPEPMRPAHTSPAEATAR